MEVILRSLYGAMAVMAVPRRPNCGLAQPLMTYSEVLNIFKVSAVPPRRFAVLTVFGVATAIDDGTTAEPRRSWRCHCGLCRTSTAVAPRRRCDGGIIYKLSHFCFTKFQDVVSTITCSRIFPSDSVKDLTVLTCSA